MRQKGEWTTLEERQQIIELRLSNRYSDRQIAEIVGCSKHTVRKWRRRFQRHGIAGIRTRIGRPTGSLQRQSEAMKSAIRVMRKEHPQWGPKTILVEMQLNGWKAKDLPSRTRLAAFLNEEGLTRRYQKRSKLPQPSPSKITSAHQQWQMDAQGAEKIASLGKMSVINIIDVASRVKVESYPVISKTRARVDDYQLALRRAFLQFGMPEQLSLDHDPSFFQNTSKSPFPMRLHLWLTALGIETRFIEKSPPQDHAIIERHHQTMAAQTYRTTPFSSQAALLAYFDERRQRLNNDIPMKVLNDKPPLAANPSAIHSGRVYFPQWEVNLLQMERVYDYLAECKWYRRVGNSGRTTLARQNYYLGMPFSRLTVAISFCPKTLTYNFSSPHIEQPVQLPALGLTKEALMGDLDHFLKLPTHQLALPFLSNDQAMSTLAAWYHSIPTPISNPITA